LERARGSTVGPDGALYVTEAAAGGVVDVAFLGRTAYALVTIVSPDVGGSSADGIYRVDGPDHFTLIADIGAFSLANPPRPGFPVSIKTGVQYALQPFRGGFLVTDGHHNRVLRVTHAGQISELIAFGNIVPTGLAVSGNTVYMAEAGPVPHLPETGKVVAFNAKSPTARQVAAGARLLVDVEFGPGRTLFALSQGVWNGVAPGSPALPNTGALVRVNEDGTFTVVTGGLDRPTSLEFIGNTAYVATLGGEIWTIDNVAGPHFGEQDQ
jgi:hypothetical protein